MLLKRSTQRTTSDAILTPRFRLHVLHESSSNNDPKATKFLEKARQLRDEAKKLETAMLGLPPNSNNGERLFDRDDVKLPPKPDMNYTAPVMRNSSSSTGAVTSSEGKKDSWEVNSEGFVVFTKEQLQSFLVPRGQETKDREDLLNKIAQRIPRSTTPTSMSEVVQAVSTVVSATEGQVTVSMMSLKLKELIKVAPLEIMEDLEGRFKEALPFLVRKLADVFNDVVTREFMETFDTDSAIDRELLLKWAKYATRRIVSGNSVYIVAQLVC